MEFKLSPHVAFDVRNYDQALKFYTEVLGMELVSRTDEEAVLKCGGTTFHVSHRDTANVYFDFDVEDADAARELLESNGCSSVETLDIDGRTSYLISDPFGMNFHIWPKKKQTE